MHMKENYKQCSTNIMLLLVKDKLIMSLLVEWLYQQTADILFGKCRLSTCKYCKNVLSLQ